MKGREIVLPAPEGMADGLSVTGQPAPHTKDGDLIVGIFVPRELRAQVTRPGFHALMTVVASLPTNSTSDSENTTAFAALEQQWASAAHRLADSTTRRLAAEVGDSRSGARDTVALPGTPPENGWCLGVSEPIPSVCQLLLILPTEHGKTQVLSETCLLVRNRMIRLLWGRPVTTVWEVAEVAARAETWAKAVAEANRGGS